MTDEPTPTTREERLAAKLRENLRRRKQQARTLADSTGNCPPSRKREGNYLSKPPPAR
jgi:hypothetical protein